MKLSRKKMHEKFLMCREFYSDYKMYKKWNYHNPNVHTIAAYQAKILRQTHVIEKGLSLSNPRVGFGVAKIKELFSMLDDYLARGYSVEEIPFQNALAVLKAYKEYQISVGYSNEEIFTKIDSLLQYEAKDFSGGIRKETLENLQNSIKGDFPVFINSRHSVRQFSDKELNYEDVLEAVKYAQKAPSACNRQATKVYFYKDAQTNNELGKLIAGNTGFDNEVKAYLVLTGDMSAFYDTFERNQLYIEGGMFAMALMEGLHYKGIASCALQNGELSTKNKKFKEICKNIPENERIILFIAIGYYKDEFSYAMSNRKNVENVLVMN
ncbi:Nitroreductase [Pseudobutyrivibrio sp. 49]|uniref:nitroreductase family protein n=1 Tax=Pseudobutyrivibrio sp. 49 TaxID=1855344 RepID=UPI000890954D|nr:nitroreductase family protein [Pseudobutyrivibrio sp. 49]SDI87168.1 Nitroreductase [Pseudobutyrivibrio sp. 49]